MIRFKKKRKTGTKKLKKKNVLCCLLLLLMSIETWFIGIICHNKPLQKQVCKQNKKEWPRKKNILV